MLMGDQHPYENPDINRELHPWSLQAAITLTEGTVFDFFAIQG